MSVHLIGSKRPDQVGKRTVKDIEKETYCDIRINFVDSKTTYRNPITVIISSHYGSSAIRDMHCAREKIQDLLLNFLQLDGDRGRLLYEVASSCPGPHRVADSTSQAIWAKDPYSLDGLEVFMSLVHHFPFEIVNGRKTFHTKFLLTLSLLTRLWKETGCYVKAGANDRSGFPVKLCFPYLLVMGRTWPAVDKACAFLQGAIEDYVRTNSQVRSYQGK